MSASDATSRPALLLLLAAGFSAGVAQVLLMRELMVLAYGNELSMGLLLACWLLAGALGSLVGRAWVHGADPAHGGRRRRREDAGRALRR